MITKVTFVTPCDQFMREHYKELRDLLTTPDGRSMIFLKTDSITGSWETIDDAFEAACAAGAIPDKLMRYE